MGFTATIYNGEAHEKFTDPGLFEAKMAEVHADKRYPGLTGSMSKVTANGRLAAQTRKGYRTPGRKAFQPRTGYDIGSEISLSIDGLVVTAQVWSLAPKPNCVWVVDDEQAAWVVDTKTGDVFEGMYPTDANTHGLCGEVIAA